MTQIVKSQVSTISKVSWLCVPFSRAAVDMETISLDFVEACVSSRKLISGMVLKEVLVQQWFFVITGEDFIHHWWMCAVLPTWWFTLFLFLFCEILLSLQCFLTAFTSSKSLLSFKLITSLSTHCDYMYMCLCVYIHIHTYVHTIHTYTAFSMYIMLPYV